MAETREQARARIKAELEAECERRRPFLRNRHVVSRSVFVRANRMSLIEKR